MPATKSEITRLNQDLTELKKQLEFDRARSKALLESIGVGVISTDTYGRIETINQAALEILGFGRNEAIGEWFPNIIKAKDEKGDDIPHIERPVNLALIEGRSITDKLRYVRKDSSVFPAEVTVSPIIFNGQPVGAIEVFRDITIESQVDTMKDDFISIASHELRTPATIVKQYISMLMDGYAGNITKNQKKMLTTAYQNNERQLAVVDGLMRVAHLDAGKIKLNLERIDVVSLFKQIIKEQDAKFVQKNQTVTLVTKRKKLYASLDEPYISMVITNLLDNASKYSPDKSEIKVTIQKNSKNLEFIVKDSGVGIEKDKIDQIFNKFSRIYTPGASIVSGSGLGLYWTKQIITMHKGTILVDSTLNKGCSFTVCLPIKQAETSTS